jgi:hypothetical protein
MYYDLDGIEVAAVNDDASIMVVDWYTALVEDCRAIMTEAVFISRWALVEGYHQLGERILTDPGWQKYSKGNQVSLQGLAKSLDISERTVYYAMQFYERFPRLETVPEGKNISWNKLVTRYLPGPNGAEGIEGWERHIEWMLRHARQVVADASAPDVYREACEEFIGRVG